MKITRLAFKNINSLAGTWCIDFEKGGYYDSGLFAILGDTASGKTSILDAVCLALFGESPRGLTPTECASWNTEDSFAEVTYEAKGGRYVSKYTISANTRGANKGKYTGKKAEFILCNARDGGTLAAGVKQVSLKNSELIGLDATQFQRVVLLAQGSFDRFLMADEKNRAAILAKITSMELYDRIGEKVRDRFSQEQGTLNTLEALCQNIVLLSEEERQELQTRLATLEGDKAAAEKRRQAVQALLKCCEDIHASQKAVDNWQSEAQKLSHDQAAFRIEAPKLALADACEPIQKGSWANLQTLSHDQQANETTLAECRNAIDKLESDATERKDAVEACDASFQAATAEQTRAMPDIEATKVLDMTIARDSKLLDEQHSDEAKRRIQLKNGMVAVASLQKTLAAETKKVAAATAYVGEHGADAGLAVKNAGWTAQFDALTREAASVATAKNAAKAAKDAEDKAETACAEAQKGIATAEKELAKCLKDSAERDAAKAKLLNGRTREDMAARLEKLYYADSADILARLRNELQDAEPCPLCGAIHHPYTENHPEDGEIRQRRDSLKADLAALDALEKQQHAADGRKLKAEGAMALAQERVNSCRQTADEKHAAAASAAAAARDAESAWRGHGEHLREEMASWGIVGWEPDAPLPDAIAQRIAKFQNATQLIQAFADRKSSLEKEIAGAETSVSAQQSELANLCEAIASLADAVNDNREKRRELFGDKNPETELKRLSDGMETARKALEASRNAQTVCLARLAAKRTEASELENAMAARQPKLDAATAQFNHDCETAAVNQEDFARFLALDAREIRHLRDVRQALATRADELKKHQRNAAEALAAAKEKLTVPMEEESWRRECIDLSDSLAAIAEETGTVKNKLATDDRNRQTHAENLQKLQRQKDTVDKWGKLYALIGKSNNFQRIAQQLTLEELLGLANRHIHELKMRYDLSTDVRSEQSLNIMVCDHFQGGELRDVKSLSGGERFEVSLALALGLADMVGSTGAFLVDCLFIDEGFGNLSRGELENALNLLQRLNSGVRGKMVGIITHVDNIEEYLRQTIRVTSLGNGVSTLEGSAVTRLQPPQFLADDTTPKKTRKRE